MIDKGKPAVIAGFFKMKASGVFDDADAAYCDEGGTRTHDLLLRRQLL